MHLPNGSQIFIERERGGSADVITINSITNAETDVKMTASAAVTGKLSAGDYVIITDCGWSKLINRVVRVKSVESSNNAFTVEGLNTKDANAFPAGSSAGKIVKIKSWIEIPCVQDLSQEGGEQQYYTFQCLSDDMEQQLPTYKSAVTLTYTFAHEYDNPLYPILRAADDAGDVKAMRMYIPRAKEMRCWSGVMSFNEIPQTAVNEMETVSLSVSLKGKFTFLKS